MPSLDDHIHSVDTRRGKKPSTCLLIIQTPCAVQSLQPFQNAPPVSWLNFKETACAATIRHSKGIPRFRISRRCQATPWALLQHCNTLSRSKTKLFRRIATQTYTAIEGGSEPDQPYTRGPRISEAVLARGKQGSSVEACSGALLGPVGVYRRVWGAIGGYRKV